MHSGEHHLGSDATIGQRNFSAGSGTHGSRYAGNNLEFRSRIEQRFDFFAGTAEDERIAALETHNDVVEAE